MVAIKTAVAIFTFAVAAAAAPSNLAPRTVDPKQACTGGEVKCCNGIQIPLGLTLLGLNGLNCVTVLGNILGQTCRGGTTVCCQNTQVNQNGLVNVAATCSPISVA